jgi:hypothetical protein
VRTGINDGPPNSIIRHDDNRSNYDPGGWAQYYKEKYAATLERERVLLEKLAATQDSYEKVSELAETLTATLRGIRDADYKEWDEGLNNPREFVRWAKSVANFALTPKN